MKVGKAGGRETRKGECTDGNFKRRGKQGRWRIFVNCPGLPWRQQEGVRVRLTDYGRGLSSQLNFESWHLYRRRHIDKLIVAK